MGIKILFKNVRKTFYNKKWPLIAVSLIIFLSAFIYTAMFLSTDSISKSMESMMESNVAEDFSIETVNMVLPDELEKLDVDKLPESFNYSLTELSKIDIDGFENIVDDRIDTITDNYNAVNYELETRRYKDISFGDSYQVRAYKDGENINKTYLEEGEFPKTIDEIGLNKMFAKNNDWSIGDNIEVLGKEYTITGFILYPDFNLPITNGEMLIDPDKKGIAMFSDEEFESVSGKEGFYLSGEYINCDEGEFQEKVIDEYKDNPIDVVSSITLTKNQLRSGAIYEEISGGQATMLGLSLFIALIAVIIVAIITFRILNSERNAIGIIKSLGYKNYEIAIPYVIYITIVSLPMLLIGYFAGIEAGYQMKQVYLEFYMLPNGPMENNIGVLITATLVPFVFIGGLSFLIIRHMLNKKALALLNNEGKNKATRLNKLVNKILKNAKAVTKFKYSYLTQSLGKFLVFLLGIFFASSLIIMGTMLYDFSDKMTKDYYESKDYQYESYIDFTKELPTVEEDQEKFLDAKVLYEGESISVKGIGIDNELFKLHDKSKTDITSKLENGVIINKALALEKNFQVGDEVELNGLENKKTYEIVDIEDNNSSAAMYMDVEELSMLISDQEQLYIGIYSKDAPSEDYGIIIKKSDVLKQSEAMQRYMTIMIYSMMIGAILIAVLILYILTTLTVEDNLYSISLLKVIGYSQREIRIIMLNSYLVYSIIAYLIAIPITVGLMNFFTVYLAQEFNMFMPMEFNLIGTVLGLVFVVVIYLLGTANANRQIKKISLQEVLKSYRE